MKKYFIIQLVLIYTVGLYAEGFHNPGVNQFSFSFKETVILYDSTNDQKVRPKLENPFKDIDFSWLKEKYRVDKIFIAVGASSLAIGLPIFLVGLISYFLPQTDKSTIGDNTNFALIGVGSSLMGIGLTFTLVGVIRINYLMKKEQKKVTLSFGFY